MIGVEVLSAETALMAGLCLGVVTCFKLAEYFLPRNRTGNPGSNPGHGERIASLETSICDLRKSVDDGFARVERRLERMETTNQER